MKKLKLESITPSDERALSAMKFMRTPNDETKQTLTFFNTKTPSSRDDFKKKLPQMVKSSSSKVIESLHLRSESQEAQQTRGFARSIQKQILTVNEKLLKETSKKSIIKKTGKDISHRLDAIKEAPTPSSNIRHINLIKQLGYGHRKKNSLPNLDQLYENIVNEDIGPSLKSCALSMPDLHLSAPPAGRRDAENLTKWLNQTLQKLEKKQSTNFQELFSAAQEIYTICFEEIVKQVSVHWKQRGQLIDVVWKAYLGILEKALKLSELQKERIAAEFENKRVDIHSAYVQTINDLQGINQNLKEHIHSIEEANDNLKHQVEARQAKIETQQKHIETIQGHYESVKEKHLVKKEKIRVMKSMIENEEDEFEVDQIGKIILRKKVQKRTIIKNIEDILQEVLQDPAMLSVRKLEDRRASVLERSIIKYEDEQSVRFAEDDFVDASTDTSDFYPGIDCESQTKLKYTQGENIGKSRPVAAGFSSRKKYIKTLNSKSDSLEILEVSESAEQASVFPETDAPRPSIQLLPLQFGYTNDSKVSQEYKDALQDEVWPKTVDEYEEGIPSSVTSQINLIPKYESGVPSSVGSRISLNPNMQLVETLLDKINADEMAQKLTEVESQFENYLMIQTELLRSQSEDTKQELKENIEQELKENIEQFTTQFSNLIGSMKEDADAMKQNKEKLHQEIIEIAEANEEKNEVPVEKNQVSPTRVSSAKSKSRKNNPNVGRRSTIVTTQIRSPRKAINQRKSVPGIPQLNRRRGVIITQFSEFKLSDRKTFKKKISLTELANPAQNLILNLRSKTHAKFKDIMPLNLLLKDIKKFYAEKMASSQNSRRDLAGFLYAQYSKSYGVQVADQKFSKLVKSCYKFQAENIRIQLFSHFLGLFEDVDSYDCDFYLEWIDLINNNMAYIGFDVPRNVYDLQIFVPFARAEECADLKLRSMISTSSFLKFNQKLIEIKKDDPSNKNELGVVDVDQFLQLLLKYKKEFNQEISKTAQTLFKIVDVDKNGYLEQAECTLLVRHVSNSRLEKCNALFDQYSDLTSEENEKAISLKKFTEFAVQKQLFASWSLAKFMQVENPDGCAEAVEQIRPNIQHQIEQIEWRFRKGGKMLSCCQEMINNLRDNIAYFEENQITWISYRLLDEESRRVVIEAEVDQYIPNIHIQEIDINPELGSKLSSLLTTPDISLNL